MQLKFSCQSYERVAQFLLTRGVYNLKRELELNDIHGTKN